MIENLNALAFAPVLPIWLFWSLTAATLTVVLIGLARRARGAGWRSLALLVVLGALTNPRIIDENREHQPDVAVVVVDESRSMTLGERPHKRALALGEVLSRLNRHKGLEVRVEHSGPPGNFDEGTRLFETLARATSDIPAGRLGGVVLLTDGQIHDVPSPDTLPFAAPLHVLLTGSRQERDRRLRIDQAPAFSLVGKKASLTFTLTDPTLSTADTLPVDIMIDGEVLERRDVPVGVAQSLVIPIRHSGDNVVELSTPTLPGELTTVNNRTAAIVRGVRDRLKVLLVSGQPHAGERAWRNLLKSDPNVDLIHFTILRPMEKNDSTPLNELALIAFPINELFEQKIHEFDLIIFDRYDRMGIIPNRYLDNIALYVREGGALLTAVGAEYADTLSLYQSPLRAVLPTEPTKRVYDNPYRPTLTDTGRLHPVTAALDANGDGAPSWGRWLRQVVTIPDNGADVLMQGNGPTPLLVLQRTGAGRSAMLLSDTIWLWGRDFDGGGPQTELMRRLAHWLMKEPELEEEALKADIKGTRLTVTRRSLTPQNGSALITLPGGRTEALTLTVGEDGGFATGATTIDAPGLYRIDDGTKKTAIVAGRLNPPESADVTTTDKRLSPVLQASGGRAFWLDDDGMPDIRRVKPGRASGGDSWLGLRENGDYIVTGLTEIPLLPASVAVLLALGGLAAAWWREGGRRKKKA